MGMDGPSNGRIPLSEKQSWSAGSGANYGGIVNELFVDGPTEGGGFTAFGAPSTASASNGGGPSANPFDNPPASSSGGTSAEPSGVRQRTIPAEDFEAFSIGDEEAAIGNGGGPGMMQSPLGSNAPSVDINMARPNGLNTISGVFAPVALSMFSVLLFMRMGFVVGQLGFLMTVVQLMLAYAIVMLTVLSLCAISSNGAIEGGGVYYMLSRSLGPEFGGAIGVLFFTANVFSCALYVSGFTEALIQNIGGGQIPDSPVYRFFYCVAVSIVLLIVCLLGAGLFAKTALACFIVICICYMTFIASALFVGPFNVIIPKANTPAYTIIVKVNDSEPKQEIDYNQYLTKNYTSFSFASLGENMFTNYTDDYTTEKKTDFALMFAIIFSGVTGLMAGANMSGELARPSVSIPRGTVQAVFTTFGIYVLTAFLTAATSSRALLQNDYTVMMDTNFSRWPILIGIFSTTLFSSMSNLIGSSRVLSRLAHDKLFGVILKPASIEIGNANPVVSVLISWLAVVGVLLIGAMNKIAKLTSIFFLLSYMGVNIATLALELTSAPNFRPTFKYFSSWTCAAGVICTATMMLVIDASMSALSVLFLLILIIFLHYQAPAGSWGSISQALIYHQVRKYLLLLDVRKEHVKYWRPQILLLVSRPASSCNLMDFVNDLKKSGLYVIGHVRKGKLEEIGRGVDPLQQVSAYWLTLVDYLKLKAFVEVTISDNIRAGIQQLIRLSGLGAMKPNTVVMGMYEERPGETTLDASKLLKDLKKCRIERAEVVEYFTASDYMPSELDGTMERLSPSDYVASMRDVLHMNKNLCIARHLHKLDKDAMARGWGGQRRCIDVWPVDLAKPVETGLGWDNSSLFLLQLACILSMSARWRSACRLRVFICVNSLQDMHRRERQLKGVLDTLRIKAESVVVPWDHVVCHAPNDPRQELSPTYVRAFNDMVRQYSSDAAITFLSLPAPPDTEAERYLDRMRMLSANLPPTLLVHGLTSVISTAL